MTYVSASTGGGETRLASIQGVSDFSISMIAVVFQEHQYQKFFRQAIYKIPLPGFKHIIQITSLKGYPLRNSGLFKGEQIVCIILIMKFPVLALNIWINVPHESGLYMIIGTSLYLQKLMYFLQVRLALSKLQISISCHICSCALSFLFSEILIYIFIYALVYCSS